LHSSFSATDEVAKQITPGPSLDGGVNGAADDAGIGAFGVTDAASFFDLVFIKPNVNCANRCLLAAYYGEGVLTRLPNLVPCLSRVVSSASRSRLVDTFPDQRA
jgi:hypothetical protein